MIWASDWVGLPYEKLGRGPVAYDCLGLFLALQKARMGRVLPDPGCTMAQAVKHDAFGANRAGWRAVEAVQEGDALLFRVKGQPLHLGYAVNGRVMLHTETEEIGSALEVFRGQRWQSRFIGAYRYDA